MNVAPFQTSETWILLIGAVLEALVKTGVIPQEYSTSVQTVLAAALPVLFQTIFRKVRAGAVPFVHPTPK